MIDPFTVLFGDPIGTPSLPKSARDIYGGDWVPLDPSERPYIFSNFVMSRDGRISFNEPGQSGGGEVSGFNAHDRWVMALLRSRADAVLVGDNTLRTSPEHRWTAEYIYPEDLPFFEAVRANDGRTGHPTQIFLSLEGDLDPRSEALKRPDLAVIVATTSRGAERARKTAATGPFTVLALGDEAVDLPKLVRVLRREHGIGNLLLEGGPRVYGGFIAADLVDDEFLTLSPVVIGGGELTARPGLIEGQAFTPERHPTSIPLTLRKAGDHLFLHSRFRYPATPDL
ncbi:deaminase [Glaciihabitans sp. INWT7]|uniref:RibD family protein n=1 Tax=Glaciihabitans sp. INWT7 TaxID=2596912 RepID=UPI0016248546|nr:dihydrofolate reductase family protein [Glaciihabitans sp. INWT7]QNE46190.1 deaminase [Glaciihabitans sp. INWT7]